MISRTTYKTRRPPSEPWICLSCRRKETYKTDRNFASRTALREITRPFLLPKSRHAKPFNRNITSEAGHSNGASARNAKLPNSPARTRFAPSPTGYMHIGGLRTALYSYLLAKRTDGQFLLRIEDTDQKRLVPDAEQRLCEDLQWAGLHWDEGPQIGGAYGPYKQSDRLQIYQQHAETLLDSGAAYRCFCTAQSSGSGGGKAAYVTSGCYQDCSSISEEQAQDRALTKNEAFTVRLKQPKDAQKRVYTDIVYGKIQRLKRSPAASQGGEDESGIDAADTILVKSDGTPTYHFANVVDDHLMQITHVIRGTEWMASTPLHYDLYTSFGWDPPAFAHVGLLVDENKAKLSKRSNTGLILDVKGMREQEGILPPVLCNFLALLGWSNPGRSDVLEMSELIRDFDLKFTKGNTIVRMEKLWYLQKQHVARNCERARSEGSLHPLATVLAVVRAEVQSKYPEEVKKRFPDDIALDLYIGKILLTDSKSYQTPQQYVERNRYFFSFDADEITHSDSFTEGASTMAFTVLTRKLLESFDFNQSYQQPLVAVKETSAHKSDLKDFAEIERTSNLIHAVINHGIWRALANPMWLMLPEDKYHEAAQAGHVPPAGQELEYVPFTNKALDLEAYAKLLGDKASNPQLTLAGIDETVKAYKEWNKGMMKYLRDKLSYGLPGPGMGQIMAILGYEECCRRLGVKAQKNGGW